ncbi:MAG: hypothetical protein COA99_13065 [Moraxellaceae bacterium]|nr:MAG: hypothetical protein COA99_13065 [Moraxellaceae bacterium]
MPTTFVIRNQEGQYLTKKSEWVSGKDAAVLYHQSHHDQALNQLIELNAKDIFLRGSAVELELSEKRRPIVVEYGPDPEQPELLDAEESDDPANAENVDAESVADKEEEYTGFIRPLNVEPRMPKKKDQQQTVDADLTQ